MRPRRTLRKYAFIALTGTFLASTLPLAVAGLSPALSEKAFAAGKDKATVDPAKDAIKQGEAEMYRKNYEAAVDHFKQAAYFSRNQYNPLAWKYLGMAYKGMREYPKAIEAFNTHLKQVTEPAVAARCDLAACYVEMGEFDKARKEIQKANVESQGKSDAIVATAMGKINEKMEEYDKALLHYEVAIKRDDVNTEALMGRARMEVRIGMREYPNGQSLNKALKHYMEIVDNRHKIFGANYEEIYYNMAQVFYKKGDHQGAIDHLHYALKDSPNSYNCHVALGKVFDDEKHIQSAIKQYELAIPNAPRGTNVDKIKTRVMYLQGLLKGDAGPAPVKPSPLMRQQVQRKSGLSAPYEKGPPPSVDSGF